MAIRTGLLRLLPAAVLAISALGVVHAQTAVPSPSNTNSYPAGSTGTSTGITLSPLDNPSLNTTPNGGVLGVPPTYPSVVTPIPSVARRQSPTTDGSLPGSSITPSVGTAQPGTSMAPSVGVPPSLNNSTGTFR